MLCISDIMTSQLQDGRSISFVASVFSPDRRHTLIVTTAAEGGSARAPARRESRRAPSTLLPRHLLKTNSPSSRLLGGGGGGGGGRGRGLIFTCMNIFSARLDCSKGGSGARDGRGGEAGARRGNCGPTRTPLSLSLSLFGSSTGRREICVRSTLVVSQRTTKQKEGTSCLRMHGREADEYVTRVFAVFTTIGSHRTNQPRRSSEETREARRSD